MDDNEYPPENDRRPHLSLERHLMVGPHVYQLTASGTGDERIGLSLVGWTASGEVVSEISGGISPDDLAPVADALTSTLAGLATLRRQRQRLTPAAAAGAPATVVAQPARRHPNQGVRWSAEDDDRLMVRYREGASPRELMTEFGRSRGGITARLEHLGLITPDGVPAARRGDAAGPGRDGSLGAADEGVVAEAA
ncbi:hypothetical protein [Actinoplanes sp. NPDC049599]|uniref:hypothetical protein n=1 Tax=Actinoplanes sp. NPDC049599 TaxID=3363903 RepID=UPI0037A56DB1